MGVEVVGVLKLEELQGLSGEVENPETSGDVEPTSVLIEQHVSNFSGAMDAVNSPKTSKKHRASSFASANLEYYDLSLSSSLRSRSDPKETVIQPTHCWAFLISVLIPMSKSCR